MATATLLLALLSLTATADNQGSQETNSPKTRLAALINEYDSAEANYRLAGLAKTKEEQDAVVKQHPRPDRVEFAPRFLEIAKKVPNTEVAEEALIWIGKNVPQGPIGEEARQLLIKNHIRSANLKSVFSRQSILAYTPSVETLMRKAIEKNPHRDVQGTATLYLGHVLKKRAAAARSPVKPQNLTVAQQQVFDVNYGPGWRDVLLKANPVALEKEAKSLLQRVVTEFGDIPNEGASKSTKPLLRDLAKQFLQEPKR